MPRFHAANVKAISAEWTLKDSQHADNAFSTWGGSSLQNILHTIEAATVAVRAVDRSEAIFPDGYEADDKGDPIALVDGDSRALSTVDEQTLELAGYSLGSYVACAVVRFDYYGEDIVNLNLLMTDFAAEHQDEIRKRMRMSRLMGMDMPLGIDYAEVNIDGVEWQLDHHPGRELHTASTRMLPVPKGSKAKPHIVLSLDGVDAREITGRSMCYGAFAAHVGEQPVACASLQRESLAGNSSIYYKVMVAYK